MQRTSRVFLFSLLAIFPLVSVPAPAHAAVPTVTSVSPVYSPLTGGVTSTIVGTGFTGTTGVTIGGSAATISSVTDTELVVVTPALGSNGNKTLVVTNADGSVTAANAFVYYDTAVNCGTSGAFYIQSNSVIAAVNCVGTVNVPSGVTNIGGCSFGNAIGGNCGTLSGNAITAVTLPSSLRTITGAGFLGASTMTSVNIPEGVTTIGNSAFYMAGKHALNIPTTVTNIDNAFYRSNLTEITFSTPTSLRAIGASTFRASPNLTSLILPDGITSLASISVGRDPSDLSNTANLKWVSLPSSLTSTTATTFGLLPLTCVVNRGDTAYLNGLTYPNSPTVVTDINSCPAPTFTSVSPTSGTTQGGISTTITGTNLSTVNSVTIDGLEASITSRTATALTFNTPVGTVGAKNIVLTTYGPTLTSTGAYTYLPLPSITSLSVTSGPVAGGTSTIVTGTNLASITVATIGGANATRASNTSTSITLTTPVGTAGAKDLVITNVNGTITLSGAFTYVVQTASFSAFSLAGSVTITPYRTPINITATVAYSSRITFKFGNLRIPGCVSIPTAASAPYTAVCKWKPSRRGTYALTAVAVPTTGGISVGVASPITVSINNRTASR